MSHPPSPPRRSTARALLLLPREAVRIDLLPTARLTSADVRAIWELYARYFAARADGFEQRVRQLPEIALFRTADGALAGLAGVDVYRVRHGGRSTTVMYTGPLLVDERYRRQNLPLMLGVRLFVRAKLRRPLERVDWLFGAVSYKSYALLPRHLAEFWPRRDRPTPDDVAAYMDALGRARFGEMWRPERGVVAVSTPLRPETAPIDDRRREDPEIRFFETANPGHREGEMLLCLCPMTWSNWAHVGRKFLRRGRDVRARGRRMRRHSLTTQPVA